MAFLAAADDNDNDDDGAVFKCMRWVGEADQRWEAVAYSTHPNNTSRVQKHGWLRS